LLDEFLKEHKAFVKEQRKVHEQAATIAQLKKQSTPCWHGSTKTIQKFKA
jgi:hypothetical protein